MKEFLFSTCIWAANSFVSSKAICQDTRSGKMVHIYFVSNMHIPNGKL